jgi:NADH-quinone oxidoreductase subunit A
MMLELTLAFVVFGLLSAVMILVNFVLGPRKPNPAREKPFECGSPPLQAAIGPVHIPFFLVALLFLLLDVEVVFFYPLALAFRGSGIGGFAALGGFVLVMALGFLYAWKKGIFRWT